jgi:hypothetical protein
MPFAAAAGVAAVAGIAGSMMQADAAENAADKSIASQRQAAEIARRDLSPWRDAGQNALAPAQDLLGLNGQDAANAAMANFQHSPGYQFQFNEGMRAVQSNAAAQGMLNSGATLKALQDRGSQLGNLDFGTYYNRLMGFVNSGQNAAAGQAAVTQNTTNQIAQTQMAEGQAIGNGYAGAAQAIGGAANGYANGSMYQDALGSQKPNALYGGGASPYAGTTAKAGW